MYAGARSGLGSMRGILKMTFFLLDLEDFRDVFFEFLPRAELAPLWSVIASSSKPVILRRLVALLNEFCRDIDLDSSGVNEFCRERFPRTLGDGRGDLVRSFSVSKSIKSLALDFLLTRGDSKGCTFVDIKDACKFFDKTGLDITTNSCNRQPEVERSVCGAGLRCKCTQACAKLTSSGVD